MSFCRSLLILVLFSYSSFASTLVQFRTVFGTIDVELYDNEKPVTVGNFIRLAQSGAYQNTFFHRVVPGFIAQGGGYFVFNPGNTNLFAPPWANLGSVPNFGQITNEFSTGPFFSNTNGTIAMAKLGGNPNSATCEWFFNLANNSGNLDNQNGGFTVFGHVIRDPGNVLGFFNAISYNNGLLSMQTYYPTDPVATNLFTTLPVTYPGSAPPRWVDLFYVNVSLLSIQVASVSGQRQISWNSVNAKTNFVEFTTVMPPLWQTLVATNGNGTRYTVTDPSSTNGFRFYRVRVNY